MPADSVVRFHLSLNVSDLAKSVEFYRRLFDREPAKQRADYAKFEPDSPPLVLSLEPSARPACGTLNHLGIRLADTKTLVALQMRLEAAGLHSQREDGVECCYAKQTKFWLHDPDGVLWEFYTLDEDIEHRGTGQTQEAVMVNGPTRVRGVVWEHRMNQPLPERIPYDDATVDEVQLRGTFNMPISLEERAKVTAEASRVLKPGGRLFVHVLTGKQPVESPELPGPASVVHYVPLESEPTRLLGEAGLTGVRFLKLGEMPCFVRNGVEMRETQLEGWKPKG